MRRRISSKLFGIAFLLAGVAWAQDDDPSRGVARISLINGDVSVRRGDSGDWVAAAVNAPLVVSDSLLTGAGSRAEIQFDYANMLRLSPNSEVRLAALEYRRYQLQVSRGTVTLSVLRDSDADVEVDTPNVSLRPARRGEYRITVREDGQSELTVRSGEAQVFTPRGAERLQSGRTMLVRGTASDPEFQIVSAIPQDDWDRWNDSRDRALERSRSYQYVSRDIYGADDLDAYGRWVYAAPYGWVWSPYGVAADWAPYRYGRWSWIDWYGWSWVSYDPWGWAPYHYGRWFHHGPYGWCWFPGAMHSRHYWRPALVAFFGWGGHSGVHVGIGFGFGNVGWVPLAPYEPYYPWYGRGFYGGFRNHTYINNSVHIVNNVNITNVYRNARVVNGITGVDSGDFARGRGGRAIHLNDVSIRNASLARGALPVAPGSQSLRFSDRDVRIANLPRSTEPTRFYSRRPAPAVDRVPFDQQRQGMEQMVRRTYEGRGTQAPGAGPSVRAGSPSEPGRTAGGRTESGNLPRTTTDRVAPRAESGNLPRTAPDRGESGWRRMGEPASRPEASGTGNMPRVEPRSQQGTSGSDRSSWRQFGSAGRQPEAAPAPSRPSASPRDSGQGNMRRDSNQGRSQFGSSPSSEPAPRQISPRSETPTPSPRIERRESPRVQPPRQERQGGGDPVRINPPIIRERSAPRSQSPSNFSRPSQPMGGRSGGEMRSGGMPRSAGGGGMSRSQGGGMSRSEGSARGGGGGRGRR